jgi:hypothetical protein
MSDCCDTNLPADVDPTGSDTVFVVGPSYGETDPVLVDPGSTQTGADTLFIVGPSYGETDPVVVSDNPVTDSPGQTITLPSMYDDILELQLTNPHPDIPVAPLGPNAPSLATSDNHMDATWLNQINPNPGYDAGVDPSTGQVGYYGPGDMTPEF